ncbi:MAG: VOC family protein [Candidatus Omnitrophica bacterium]|nr:VOC family protein [Candidatus Omnitrophota bacterium]
MKLRVSFYYVGDLKKAAQAYLNFLGLSPSYADEDWVRFQLEGGDLALHLNEELPETSEFRQMQTGAVVSFTVQDLQTTLQRAEGSGFHQVGEIRDLPYGRQVQLRDPWGNRLSLVEPK